MAPGARGWRARRSPMSGVPCASYGTAFFRGRDDPDLEADVRAAADSGAGPSTSATAGAMKRRAAQFAAALASLPRAVWLLSAISLLNDSASDLVYPLLPLYVAGVLAAGPRALGVIEGAAEATSALLKLVSGVWYDRVRRAKPFVVA